MGKLNRVPIAIIKYQKTHFNIWGMFLNIASRCLVISFIFGISLIILKAIVAQEWLIIFSMFSCISVIRRSIFK